MGEAARRSVGNRKEHLKDATMRVPRNAVCRRQTEGVPCGSDSINSSVRNPCFARPEAGWVINLIPGDLRRKGSIPASPEPKASPSAPVRFCFFLFYRGRWETLGRLPQALPEGFSLRLPSPLRGGIRGFAGYFFPIAKGINFAISSSQKAQECVVSGLSNRVTFQPAFCAAGTNLRC